MGDLQAGSRQPNGVVREDCPSAPPYNPDPSAIGEDSWVIGEKTTQELVGWIHPTLDSEEKRKDVIEYIQRLIRLSLGCEVFPYGSVPLKTYLPDGDIDLTALCSPNVEENLAHDVLAVLQGEEQNENAEYEVKDTQFIDAEVKLVKCLVQNIVIDISVNQLGGLCTLCFLEQVDRIVGRDHLFKRSIILIKAWCYYESRILGAHHGLISTYALETLVLYIFNLFHASLNGPLAVLYRFLDYFSRFDWENYCISLKGPVSKSSLPDTVVETANVGDNLMLSDEFLRNCMDIFSVPSRVLETNLRAFPQKHLNIIDPLKENNNLGRSVHRGNYYRIRSAFKYGARKLGQILLLQRERIADEIKRFFANTLERHGHSFSNLSSASHSRTLSVETIQLNLNFDLDNNISGVNDHELDRYLVKDNSLPNGIGVSGSHLSGEASVRNGNDTSDCSPSSRSLSNSLSGLCYAPHLYFSRLSVDNGTLENGLLNEEANVEEEMGFDSWMEHRESNLGANNAVCSCSSNHEGVSSSGSGMSSPVATISEGPLDFRERDLADIIVGSPDTLNPLSDLSGDYDSHIRSLLYGQCCHGYALSAPTLPNSPTYPSQFQSKKPFDTGRQSMPLKRNGSSQMNTNGVVLGPTQNLMNNSAIPFNSTLCLEEIHKPRGLMDNTIPFDSTVCLEEIHQPRGTGTYFPDSIIFDNHTYENPMNNPTPTDSRLCLEQSLLLKRNASSQMNTNGVVLGPTQNLMNNAITFDSTVCLEEIHKPRGTGTYFPDSIVFDDHTYENPMNNPTPSDSRLWLEGHHKPRGTGTYFPDSPIIDLPMKNPTLSNSHLNEMHKPQGNGTYFPESNGCACKERCSQAKERNHHAQGNNRQLHKHNHNNGSTPSLRDVKSGLSRQSTPPSPEDSHVAAGFSVSSQKLEFGSFGHLPEESSQPFSDTSSTPSLVELEVKSSKAAVLGNNQERGARQSFHLKDEDDFPPLTN